MKLTVPVIPPSRYRMTDNRLYTIEGEVLSKKTESSSMKQQLPPKERINTYIHQIVRIHEQNTLMINDVIEQSHMP